MKTGKKFNDSVYFVFLFINGLKKLLHFLCFKMMITLLVTCLLINIFFGSLGSDTFSNLKLNVFVITGFICSSKYEKKVVLINHSCISRTLQKRLGLEFCLFSKNWGRVHFTLKRGEVGKKVEDSC